MITVSRLFQTNVGATSLSSSLLTNVVILRVCRAGLGYNTIAGTAPGSREVQYVDGEGKLIFQDPFAVNPSPQPGDSYDSGELIYVRYKY